MRIQKILVLFVLSLGLTAQASAPPRLLTMETANSLNSRGVIGLQQAGAQLGSLLIETNPLYDLALTANVAAKYVWRTDGPFSYMLGGRYLKFFGSDLVESRLKQAESRIERFQLAFQGPTAYAGASWEGRLVNVHANFQWAEVSGSRVRGLVAGVDLPFASIWSAALESGYDFANKQVRASFGAIRSGESFGLRFGLTYIHIDDPSFKYAGVFPVVDFFWLLGGKSTDAPAVGG